MPWRGRCCGLPNTSKPSDRLDQRCEVMSDTGGVREDLPPVCATCGSQFECFGGRPPTGVGGWFECGHRCGVCSGPLDDGRSVMEHPGLGALIHLACSPVPSEPEAAFELL